MENHLLLATPSGWLALPFFALLCMIAMGPLFFAHAWHKHYPKISLSLAGFVLGYYWIVLESPLQPMEAVVEYVQFMSLITALYMATGIILIKINLSSTPLTNSIFLACSAFMANFIGTTGASLLLIRPYLRLNKKRIKPYHIVFFIFTVSNVGGSLTPIGDPPLFLGFLKGVPFSWTCLHNWKPLLVALACLLVCFYWLDKKNAIPPSLHQASAPPCSIEGKKHLIWLVLTIGAVFLDPTICSWIPYIHYGGRHVSFCA